MMTIIEIIRTKAMFARWWFADNQARIKSALWKLVLVVLGLGLLYWIGIFTIIAMSVR